MADALGPLELTGRTRAHVVDIPSPRCSLESATADAFLGMRAAAAREGIDLVAASSFRDFDRQLLIWNGKFRGERKLLDARGREIVAASLEPARRVAAILVWSALPGASRHHWGTDLDLYDRAALPEGVAPALVPVEYQRGGPFARLADWLDRHARRHGFYRPFDTDRGGVRPEPWHYSFAPRARGLERRVTAGLLLEALSPAGLEGWDCVAARLPAFVERYVRAIDPPPRMRSRLALAVRRA